MNMKEMYKNILLQGWMFDPLEVMEKDEQDKYKLALIDTAIAGKVQTDNPKWKRLLEKALSAIEETRANFYEKSQKNGMKKKNLVAQLKCLMVYHVLMIVRGKNENKTSF